MATTSAFLTWNPRARIEIFSSRISTWPEPSTSNKSKASRISCICSSDKLYLFPDLTDDPFFKDGDGRLGVARRVSTIDCRLGGLWPTRV
eukprot:CAMPEP_0172207484 /NCGR_PEP_ID=MMETSP1050-20130122/33860_1 /TAXON_ID=233186 /ORGANISM="Cryptomonas curvata, Strain CCAP979/52" /LENGTH=89 /DNA_ID=CAMNT_0012886805 /DNA_START=755 /DNA_END=1024 /DNA_ORIENTATION=+